MDTYTQKNHYIRKTSLIIYTIEYYSAKKKGCIWVSSNEVNETGAYYTEWNKSGRKTPIRYINAYIWNLERWHWWPYMQDSKRPKCKEQTLDYVTEGEDGMIWEKSIEMCILPYVKQMTSRSLMHEAGHSKLVLWDNPEGRGGEGGGGGSGWGDTCIPMADSCQCMAKTTIL